MKRRRFRTRIWHESGNNLQEERFTLSQHRNETSSSRKLRWPPAVTFPEKNEESESRKITPPMASTFPSRNPDDSSSAGFSGVVFPGHT